MGYDAVAVSRHAGVETEKEDETSSVLAHSHDGGDATRGGVSRLAPPGVGRNTSLVSEASDPRQEQLRNLLILLPSLIGASYPPAA